MLLKRRWERSMDTMKERNKRYLEERQQKYLEEHPEERERIEKELAGIEAQERREAELADGERKAREQHEEEMGLEKGDLPALMISAFLVFGPILLVVGAVIALVWHFQP